MISTCNATAAAASLFSAQAPDDGDLMVRFGLRMAFARTEEVYTQGDEADLLYQVASGAVRTSRVTSDGRRQIGDFYYPGDIFGLERGAEHRFSAEALGDAVVLVVKRRALALAAGEQAVEHLIAAATACEMGRLQEHLMLLGRKTACEKVASFLLGLADRSSGSEIDLPMGRQDMADYLGLTIETVSRMVTQLQQGQLVDFTGCRRFSICNRPALERLSD